MANPLLMLQLLLLVLSRRFVYVFVVCCYIFIFVFCFLFFIQLKLRGGADVCALNVFPFRFCISLAYRMILWMVFVSFYVNTQLYFTEFYSAPSSTDEIYQKMTCKDYFTIFEPFQFGCNWFSSVSELLKIRINKRKKKADSLQWLFSNRR